MILAGLMVGSVQAQQLRLATIDLRKVFDGYWKKKQAEAALKERQAEMEKEDKNMIEDYKKMKEEYQGLLNGANDQAVSADERDKRKRNAEDKLRHLKEMEETIGTYERQARTTITEQSQRMRANILNEIRNVVNGKAKAANYTLVLDTAAESINSTPVVMFTTGENDMTDAVLTQLNANAPAELPKTEIPAVKDDKKKENKK